MTPTKEDMDALASILNTKIDENDFEFSEEVNGEELVFDEIKTNKPKEDTRDYSSISVPHWLLDKEEIQRMLDTLSNVIIPSGEMVNKSIHVKRNLNKLVFSFNSNEIQGQFEVTLSNLQNLIDEDKKFILNYKDLVLAVRSSKSKVILKDNPDSTSLSFEVLNGEDELENYLGIDENSYTNISKTDFNEIPSKPVDYETFLTFLKNVSYTEKLSMRPEDRKVRLQGQEAFSNYALVIVNYKNLNLDDFSLRLTDVSFLIKLLNATKGNIQLSQTASNTYVIGSSFKISLPKVNTEDLKYVKRICNDLKVISEFTMATYDFYNTLSYLRQRTGNGSTIHLFTENGKLKSQSKTINQKPISFSIAENLDSSISIDTKLPIMTLVDTVKLFKEYPSIKVSVTDTQRVIFEVEEFKLIFGNLT